jgi:O-antigen ligase
LIVMRLEHIRRFAPIVLCALMIVTVLLSHFLFFAGPEWIHDCAKNAAYLFNDPFAQWVLVFCLVIYVGLLLLVTLGIRSRLQTGLLLNRNIWLGVLIFLVLLRDGFPCDNINKLYPVEAIMLLVGVAFGKTCLAACRYQVGGVQFGVVCLLAVLMCSVAATALWQTNVYLSQEFSYHGILRWSGIFGSPNLFGLLMGMGFILGVGGISTYIAFLEQKMFNVKSRQRLILGGLFFLIIALCGCGLWKSYSRGAWLGTAVGLAYLIYQLIQQKREKQSAVVLLWRGMRRKGEAKIKNRIAIAVILISVFVLAFWEFRFSEWLPLQRIVSITNPNDFSWRNRVAAWQGAVRMMADKPLFGFGWGKAGIVYGEDYCPQGSDKSAAIQMNDYFMLGISAGVPALICYLAYIWLCLKPRLSSPYPNPLSSTMEQRGNGGAQNAEVQDWQNACSTLQWLQTTCRAGAIVLAVGFFFDGGLFQLSVGPIFWMLMELSRIEGPVRVEVTRLKSETESDNLQKAGNVVSSEDKNQGQSSCLSCVEIWLRRGAWTLGIVAFLQTSVYLSTPFFFVSRTTLAIARKCLIAPKEIADFDFLSTNVDWHGKYLQILLQNANLANYNRELINWQVDDKIYQDYVLSPDITGNSGEQLNWRRSLWEELYPRIRHESSPEDAAKIVVCYLRERVTVSALPNPPHEVLNIWLKQITDEAGFEIIYIAALRSVGIPARLNNQGQAELFKDGNWESAPRPVTS